jgi:integrase
LTVPDFRPKARTLPWEKFPASFVSDVGEYLDWLTGHSLDDDGPIRPCKPRTLETRRKMIHLAASAAVQAGKPVETFQSLADLVAPPTVKAILEIYLAKNDGKVKVFVAGLAGVLCSIARVWCKRPEPELEHLQRFRKRLDQQRPKGLTEKNMAVIRQVLDEQTWRRVQNLPQRLMDEALQNKTALDRAAVKAQIAVAIQILIVAPLRISNLVALSLDENLVRPAGPNGQIHIVIPDYDVKNGMPLEYPLPEKVSRMTDFYCSRFRHVLKGSNGPWLFPGQNGGHKVQRTMSQQITETLWRACGIRMTPHQFRHAAGAIILKYDPGNYELVRRVLGNKSLQTTINAYVGLETLDAARLFSRIALGETEREK